MAHAGVDAPPSTDKALYEHLRADAAAAPR